jgi:OmpA-OmpF porin, OOP family
MKRKVFFIVAILIACAISVNIYAQESADQMIWNSYDFVPGDVIIFEDNLEGERNGEFPSRWDLVDGLVENAEFEGENVIMFRKCNANGRGGIIPLMKNSSVDYLPNQFTIEFDAYFDIPQRVYRVMFYDGKNQVQLNTELNGARNKNDRIRIYQNSADFANGDRSYYPGFVAGSDEGKMSNPGWRRVSISFNTRALKVYLDDARLINIPNMEFNPCGITIAYHNTSGRDHAGFIKNIRIAEGAVPLYDKLLTDGKIVSSGIRFDVAKASLRPESMGVINEIYNLMAKHPELKFSIEGHTDSDGNAESNQKLSEDRALTVMNQLMSMGIDKDRLTHKGFGQTQPIADNSTTEGKAENRRVEFIKFD